ncbi:hypothetical protein SISSUDRAFT_1055701 [Sistotremastrum suecicum HHB10207 ss-3]|uniref:Uncharacterized protein n=1 Tax=Sistotremastrum suecicum HHB10207 ss-3 TaxID=1314776 RepID=A0A165XL79_9AGAM|nr:hypothetical protein SISSUDRAFT_1055701 [Sistotremastrum suecicum HHB10207 ss-3]
MTVSILSALFCGTGRTVGEAPVPAFGFVFRPPATGAFPPVLMNSPFRRRLAMQSL